MAGQVGQIHRVLELLYRLSVYRVPYGFTGIIVPWLFLVAANAKARVCFVSEPPFACDGKCMGEQGDLTVGPHLGCPGVTVLRYYLRRDRRNGGALKCSSELLEFFAVVGLSANRLSRDDFLFVAIKYIAHQVIGLRWCLGDRNSHKAVATKHQNKKDGKLSVVTVDNDDAPDGLPAVHTDRHIYPNKTAAEAAAKARLAAFNRSTADVRFEMPGRTDIFAERLINAQGFKVGLDGEYLVDSVEQVFTQSGWSTTVECNAGKQGKSKGKKKKEKKPLKVVSVEKL